MVRKESKKEEIVEIEKEEKDFEEIKDSAQELKEKKKDSLEDYEEDEINLEELENEGPLISELSLVTNKEETSGRKKKSLEEAIEDGNTESSEREVDPKETEDKYSIKREENERAGGLDERDSVYQGNNKRENSLYNGTNGASGNSVGIGSGLYSSREKELDSGPYAGRHGQLNSGLYQDSMRMNAEGPYSSRKEPKEKNQESDWIGFGRKSSSKLEDIKKGRL